MCGIAGVFDLRSGSNSTNDQLVKSAIGKMQHRGPDEQGFYNHMHCNLGMCRLAIIDVKGGKQPSWDSRGKIVTVFNGEIYNFKELRELLISRGYSLFSQSDSEVIPNLYREFGDDFPKYLNGMFSIALWDEERSRGMLVRDRFGKKPLWYKSAQDTVSFASELKGLIEINGSLDFDSSRLPEYLQFGYINAPRSIYKGVQQLNPGTSLIFDKSGKSEYPFWDFPIAIKADITYEEAKADVKSLVTDAVSLRLISERPVGAFLSGGIDSSLVTALMSRELGADTHTYSIGFNNPKFDESRYARDVANHLGAKHHEKIVLPDPALILNEISRILDQPFADSSIVPSYLLAKFARSEVVVALGGDGGDEVFGGYTRYRVARLLEKLNFLLLLSPSPILRKLPIDSRRVEKLLRHLNYQEFRHRYFGFQSLIQSSEIDEIIKEDFEETLFNLELIGLWDSIDSSSQLRKLQQFDLQTYLPGDLMYKADMATMANSLELRSPLLDYRVVEYGLTLPDEFKLKSGVSKRILRDVLYEFIPRELVDRPKMGFGIPQGDWLRKELAPLVKETLLSNSAFIRNHLDMARVDNVIQKHQKGFNFDRVIWPILMLELWAKNWIN
jgi:asparagine synthase (glutamine-hydrolysing)